MLAFEVRRGQWQAGFRIQVADFRHLIDRLFRRPPWRNSGVLFPLPLECAVPRRKLCRRKGHDFVDVGELGIAAVMIVDEFANQRVAA
ncbi:hypothetical protein WJ02_16220 [Burkholderia vietnamiensis]|nr:hypothetical protein WJ02_16220 [Burkholderia vietnamiensis]